MAPIATAISGRWSQTRTASSPSPSGTSMRAIPIASPAAAQGTCAAVARSDAKFRGCWLIVPLALTAPAPRAVALPLVQGPGHVVLIVRGRLRRHHADELAPAGVVGGRVPCA